MSSKRGDKVLTKAEIVTENQTSMSVISDHATDGKEKLRQYITESWINLCEDQVIFDTVTDSEIEKIRLRNLIT